MSRSSQFWSDRCTVVVRRAMSTAQTNIASTADAAYVSDCGHVIAAITVAPMLATKAQELSRLNHHV